jgi:hypothetical protein
MTMAQLLLLTANHGLQLLTGGVGALLVRAYSSYAYGRLLDSNLGGTAFPAPSKRSN